MRFLPLLFLAFLTAVSSPAQSQPEQSPSPYIQVSVNRVNVGVTVTDAQGNFVPDLRRENFQILDNGVEQPITDFANVIAPAEVLLLVEAGPAVYFLASTHVQASHTFLEGLSTGDRIAVAKYDSAPQIMLDFTTDKPAAYGALANVRYYVGFGNLNLSKSLNTVLDWLAKTQGKKTIVLLSTGFDTSSPSDIDAALTRLKISDVRLLAISLSGAMRATAQPPTGKKKNKKDKTAHEEEAQKAAAKAAFAQQGFDEADRLLRALTDATGGQVYFPDNPRDYATMYAQIAQRIRHEYSLAFTPPAHDGKVHNIEVRVTPPDTTTPSAQSTAPSAPTYNVAARRAYVAPAQ
ncbi:MAG TPA: VWA domain-containing protein [Candidatus Sulfotelmatobacter sp.]|nr:VWA domain-containing protein [Candidatus Sulfotelmatobacter sp.]